MIIYVLGNNFFGDDVRTMLEKLGGSKERSAYVLMERVWPVEVKNYPVRYCDRASVARGSEELPSQ